ncbi:MAG: hypothetical protein E7B44_18815, partial [Flavonifractor plautii]|nr:hypothetical protein [Flavonifractor plautii]
MSARNKRPVIQCVLSNAAHPEYSQATIPFPIPVQEYGCTLELLTAMGLGHPTERDSRVDELESGFPILKRLEKVGANLDELDYLARRL